MKEKTKAPDLLSQLLEARSPSGFEFETQAVLDKQLKPVADDYQKDVLGNRIGILNPKGDPTLMLAGHMDELGFLVKYIDDNGFIYFKTIGGHDNILISGRRDALPF
jgi:endoglucanase